MMSRARSESLASLEYYRTDDAQLQISAREGLQAQDNPDNDRIVQQSRRLPFWLWYIIAKSLGIKLNVQDRPIFATILYSLTFMSALGYVLTNWWFTAYDIVSDYTKTTVIDGTASIFFSILWVSLGIYANKLAYRLFSHKKFLNMLRLHSKTILKMNAAAVLFTLMLLFAVINNISAYPNFKDETCKTVGVEVIVCKLRYILRVLYSVFAVIWNYLVGFVVVSVCRTHVIGIRKFMQALEQDARIYEARFMGLTQQASTERPLLEEYTWLDEDYFEELQEPGSSDLDSNASALMSQQGSSRRGIIHPSSSHLSSGMPSTQVPSVSSMPSHPAAAAINSEVMDAEDKAETSSAQPINSQHGDDKASSVHTTSSTQDGGVKHVSLMSNSEILFRYWKIQFICLVEERLQLIFVLQNSPLQMTVFGFTLSYSTITTASFGILLAFASKVLIQEISVPPK